MPFRHRPLCCRQKKDFSIVIFLVGYSLTVLGPIERAGAARIHEPQLRSGLVSGRGRRIPPRSPDRDCAESAYPLQLDKAAIGRELSTESIGEWPRA